MIRLPVFPCVSPRDASVRRVSVWPAVVAGWQGGPVTAARPEPVPTPEPEPDSATGSPTLTDGVVTLRLHTGADADAVVEQSTDADSLRWTTVPRRYGREDALSWIEGNRAAWLTPDGTRSWAIDWVDPEDPEGRTRFGGTIDLRPLVRPGVGELGFGLHPDARGHGVMARAVRLVLAHAFRDGGWGQPLTRVHWRAVRGNWGSRRVAWATGFTPHGTIPGSHPDPTGEAPALDTWTASIGPGDDTTPAAPWFEPMVVEAPEAGLRLRPWRLEDAAAIEPRDADPTHWMPVRSVLSTETFPLWLLVRQERMAEGTAIDWCVADAATDRALGGVTVFSRVGPMTGDAAELGYQLFPSARGRGVAKTAARLATAHAFRAREEGGLGLRRLVAETAADNAASNAVLRATGFSSWGREERVDVLADGAYGDGLHWHLFRDDWIAQAGRHGG